MGQALEEASGIWAEVGLNTEVLWLTISVVDSFSISVIARPNAHTTSMADDSLTTLTAYSILYERTVHLDHKHCTVADALPTR
jgi:hypothetical protein